MPTSGPIVRTGATPEFWRNWENVFGGKKKPAEKAAPAKTAVAKKKPAAKKAAVKPKSAKKK